MSMDDDTAKYLWALKEINKSLITGLESAILVMDKWDDITPERRQSMIESLQQLVSQSNKVYETEPTKH
jgi:hypothetical protein